MKTPGLFVASILGLMYSLWFVYGAWIEPKRFFGKFAKSMNKAKGSFFYFPPHPISNYFHFSGTFIFWLYRIFFLLMAILFLLIMLITIYGFPSWIELP